jgi:acyl carrier protein
MTLANMQDAIIEKIAELGEIEPGEVSEDCALRDLGIDSLMAIELIVFIEKILKRSFPEEKMGTIQTCADVFREVELLVEPAA